MYTAITISTTRASTIVLTTIDTTAMTVVVLLVGGTDTVVVTVVATVCAAVVGVLVLLCVVRWLVVGDTLAVLLDGAVTAIDVRDVLIIMTAFDVIVCSVSN